MRFPDHYRKFKETGGNEASGTPLQNLPGLTAVQLSTLKALSIFSIENLASLEGQNIKNLGPQGHSLKQAAQKYLAAAGGRIGMTEVLAQLAASNARIEELSRMVAAGRPEPIAAAIDPAETFGYDGLTDALEVAFAPDPEADPRTDDELKEAIAAKHGSRPRGQPNRSTLLNMLAQDAAA
jgi:hypothetical protein